MSVLMLSAPTERHDDGRTSLRDIDPGDKTVATARARLALAGWTLNSVYASKGATSIIADRLGTSRVLPDLHALHQFTRMVEGAQ